MTTGTGLSPQLNAIVAIIRTILLFIGGAAITFAWSYWLVDAERIFAVARAETDASHLFGTTGAWNWGGEMIRHFGPYAASPMDQVFWPLVAYRSVVVAIICAAFVPISWACFRYGSIAASIKRGEGQQSRSGAADIAFHVMTLTFAIPGILIFLPVDYCFPVTAPILIASIPIAAWNFGRFTPFEL